MTENTSSDPDQDRPSQAEGAPADEDTVSPGDPETDRPSQAEGAPPEEYDDKDLRSSSSGP